MLLNYRKYNYFVDKQHRTSKDDLSVRLVELSDYLYRFEILHKSFKELDFNIISTSTKDHHVAYDVQILDKESGHIISNYRFLPPTISRKYITSDDVFTYNADLMFRPVREGRETFLFIICDGFHDTRSIRVNVYAHTSFS